MDIISRKIDGLIANDDITIMIHQQKVGDPDMAEIDAKRVNPEMIRPFRIAHGDMAGRAMVKAV